MAFEKFVPPQSPGPAPKATIRPTGLISFDARAVEEFGIDKGSHAVLYFDKTRKLIGVELTKKGDEDGAYKLTRRRRSVSVKAPQFFEEYGIEIDSPARFDVGFSDRKDLVTIDVQEVKRRRGRRAKSS